MDMQQTASELQKFADAHGMNIDVAIIIDNMDAGDFVALNGAMDNSDNRTIMQLLQKYKAHMSESYNYFSPTNFMKHINESSELCSKIDSMSAKELTEHYRSMNTYCDVSSLSIQELKALVFEDITSQLKSNQAVNMNNNTQQMNPQTQAKLKQAELQKNANNMQVTVPGTQSGTDAVEPVVGVDIGSTPDQSLVITKNSSKPNELNVFSLDDVTPVDPQNQRVTEDQETRVSDEKDPSEINDELMAPTDNAGLSTDEPSDSPLTNHQPGMGEMIHAINDIEKDEDLSGEESQMGNSAQSENDDMINQIIDACSRMRGL